MDSRYILLIKIIIIFIKWFFWILRIHQYLIDIIQILDIDLSVLRKEICIRCIISFLWLYLSDFKWLNRRNIRVLYYLFILDLLSVMNEWRVSSIMLISIYYWFLFFMILITILQLFIIFLNIISLWIFVKIKELGIFW